MNRGIDHLVLCVNDLKMGRALYEALGFTVTPQAQHPFGTGNVIVQLDGCFLEILSVTQPDDIPAHADGHFNFAAFNQRFLNVREGMSMLVLDSDDEERDRNDFIDAGLHVYAPFEFQRQQTLPGGETATVGFSLTFADDPEAMPEMAFFTCKQWRPDLFWKPEYQTHENQAHTVSDVFIVADDRSATGPFLSGLTGQSVATEAGVDVYRTSRGTVSVMGPDAFDARFPGARDALPSAGPYFAGFEIAVPDLTDVTARLSSNNLNPIQHDGRVWLPPAECSGCVIAFSDR